MKIIPKYQRGGGFEQFFTVYQPSVSKPSGRQSGQASEEKSSKTSSKDKGKLTEKDFFTMLKEVNGLPNDMNAIVSSLVSTFQMSNLTGINTENLATTYLQSLMQIKVATDNKATYDKAIEQANKNGAMAEPAISLDGNFLAQTNEGKVVKVSPEEYFDNKDSYQILSVSNIANLRKYDPQLAFSNSYVDIINNSIGFEGFQALLKQAIDGLGTSENSRQGLFSYEGQAIKGLELLQTLGQNDKVQALGSVTEEGLYKYEIIDKTQLSQINSLLSYIMSTFPNNAKTWAAFKLNTSDKDKATRDLILNYLLSKSSNSHNFKTSYDKNIKQLTGESKSGSKTSTDEPDMTFLTALQNGYGDSYETRKYNPGGNGAFYVTGSYYGAFLNQKGDVINDVTLQGLLTQTGLAGITNPNSITFGDNLIKSNQLPLIAVQNTGGVYAILPCKRNGTQVTPDFELMGAYDTLVQEVNNELGSTATFEQREEALQRKIQQHPELKELLDVSGKLDYNKFCAFVVVDGLASDLNFTFKSKDGRDISESSNPLIQKTDDEADQKYFDSVTQEKLNDGLFKNVFGLGINKDMLYKSAVFIPINTNNRLAGVLFSGQKLKDSTALRLQQEYQTSLGKQELNSSNPLLLWQ